MSLSRILNDEPTPALPTKVQEHHIPPLPPLRAHWETGPYATSVDRHSEHDALIHRHSRSPNNRPALGDTEAGLRPRHNGEHDMQRPDQKRVR